VLATGLPILGICYGLQFITHHLGGKVVPGAAREYGHAKSPSPSSTRIFHGLPRSSAVWMSHGDHAESLAPGFRVTATTSNAIAAIANDARIWAVQFHPEVAHTATAWSCSRTSSSSSAAARRTGPPNTSSPPPSKKSSAQVGPTGHAICGLSGGVDSSVAAVLVARAIGDRLTCIFVNNGVLRKDEFAKVQKTMREDLHLNVVAVDASERFLAKLAGVTDPEQKRKAIGNEFIAVFDDEAKKIFDAEKSSGRELPGWSRARSTPTSSSPPASTAPRTSSRATTTSAACLRT
jgi:GMP synthase (glutamine-hydrolysing)